MTDCLHPDFFSVRGATIDETESITGTCPECEHVLHYGDPIYVTHILGGVARLVRCDECEVARHEPSGTLVNGEEF